MNRALVVCAGLALFAVARPVAAECGPAGSLAPHSLAAAPPGAVRVRGVVTAVFPGLRGFFLESERARWDRNPRTPEAIFVYTGRRRWPLEAGERIALAGELRRFHGVRELTRPGKLVRCGSVALPPAVDVKLPLPGGWSTVLGMRVRLVQTLVVDDLADLGRYGELRVSAGGRRLAPTALTSPGPGALALAQAERERSVWIDDGTTRAHPWPLELAGRRFDAGHPLRAGQGVRNLQGIAYRAFGRDLVKAGAFTLVAATAPRPDSRGPDLAAGLRIASFNVDNYFNRAFSGAAFPTERGARTRRQFACQTAKLVSTLAALEPALAGLEEIQNNGYAADGALAGLVRALNQALGAPRYRYVVPDASRLGSDRIAPALIYDAARLAPVGRPAVLTAKEPGPVAQGLKRPALAASFRDRREGLVLTVAVVHLRAKLDSCGAALDSHDGGGYCAGARDAAARLLLRWLATGPTGVRADAQLLLGDLNAYPDERAIRLIEAGGWEDVIGRFIPSPAKRYTTNYEAGAGALDYVFAHGAAAKRVVDAAVWHVNADEASLFGYRGHAACTGPYAPYRASDHDPVVVVLSSATQTTGG